MIDIIGGTFDIIDEILLLQLEYQLVFLSKFIPSLYNFILHAQNLQIATELEKVRTLGLEYTSTFLPVFDLKKYQFSIKVLEKNE
jgi:hypothetical protein